MTVQIERRKGNGDVALFSLKSKREEEKNKESMGEIFQDLNDDEELE